jgi:hypothetical protein
MKKSILVRKKKNMPPGGIPHHLIPPPANSAPYVHPRYWPIMTLLLPVLKIPWMLKEQYQRQKLMIQITQKKVSLIQIIFRTNTMYVATGQCVPQPHR